MDPVIRHGAMMLIILVILIKLIKIIIIIIIHARVRKITTLVVSTRHGPLKRIKMKMQMQT